MHKKPSQRQAILLLITTAVTVSLLLGGCGRSGRTQSVADADGLFHFNVPAAWQYQPNERFISVYAGNKLPTTEDAAKDLSVLVFTSSEASKSAEADVLRYLIKARAASRGWQALKMTSARQIALDGRPAIYIDSAAKNADGQPFEGRFYFTRTQNREVLVAAIAPFGKKIDSFEDDLTQVTENWYWHDVPVAAADTTPTKQ